MVVHIKDAETDANVRELARRRGLSITDAVRLAVEDALASEAKRGSLWSRTADIRERFSKSPETGLQADKSYFDDLSEQDTASPSDARKRPREQ